MRINRVVAVIGLGFLLAGGCSKNGNPVSPSLADDFPASSKFSVTLYSASQSVVVGQSFEVRVVLYNVTNVSGCALKISYPSSMVLVDGVAPGTSFLPPDSVLSISRIEQDSGRVSYGVAYANSGRAGSKSGSGVICILDCKAKAAGTCSFVVDPASLEVKTPDGTLIQNFSTLLLEDFSVTVH